MTYSKQWGAVRLASVCLRGQWVQPLGQSHFGTLCSLIFQSRKLEAQRVCSPADVIKLINSRVTLPPTFSR